MVNNSDIGKIFKHLSEELEILITLRDFFKELHGVDCNPDLIIDNIKNVRRNYKKVDSVYEEMFDKDVTKAIASIGNYLKLIKVLNDYSLLHPIKTFLDRDDVSYILNKNKNAIWDSYNVISKENLFNVLGNLDITMDIQALKYPSDMEFLNITIKGNKEIIIELDEPNRDEIQVYYDTYGKFPPQLQRPSIGKMIETYESNLEQSYSDK